MIRVRSILNKCKRAILVSVGLMCLGLGIVGYVMPGLPGTIWLIISAMLFVRSSDRLYFFVINNRLFGRQVGEFLKTGAMPLRAKVISISFMWIFSMISVLLAPYSWLFKIPILLLAIIGTIYILSRGTTRDAE